MPSRRYQLNHRRAPPARRAHLYTALFLLVDLCFAGTMPAIALAGTTTFIAHSAPDPYSAEIALAAHHFRVAPSWIAAVLDAESAGDPAATSPKGAMGLMQLVPGAWSDLRIRYRLGSDPYDPHDNIFAGAAYIRELFDRYGTPGWIAAYNAGPARYEASLEGEPLPEETRAYVAIVSSAIARPAISSSPIPAVSSLAGWNHAPLFVARSDGGQGADDAYAAPSSPSSSRQESASQAGSVAPRRAGLFVASGRERRAP